MALHHQAEDLLGAAGHLSADITRHFELFFVLLRTVGMAAIDHQRGRQLRSVQVFAGGSHAGSVIVGRLAAAQNHVAIAIALGLHNRHLPVFVHRQKVVTAGRRLNGVGGNADIAVGAVFKTNGRRNTRSQLAVHLAFGGAGTDGAPGNEVANVLRRNHVQKLTAGGQTQPVDIDQQLARNAQAFVNAVALVQVGVVDQSFPAHGGTRLFKIHAHHDFQRAGVLVPLLDQAARVLQRGSRVMDGTWADDQQQSVVGAGHDVVDALTGLGDQRLDRRSADREKADQMFWRWKHGDVLDALVIGLAGFVDGTGIPALAGGLDGGIHDGLPWG